MSIFKNIILKFGVLAVLVTGLSLSGAASADDCPVGLLNGKTLDEEFGLGTSGKTTCLDKREDIKIVMQLNKSCRDSYATHPTYEKNGKPTGEASKVVNNIANCANNRAYALGNLRNMLNDLTITNGIDEEEIHIKVVVHSGGGYVLLKDAGSDGNGNYIASGRNKFEGLVQGLIDDGVEFYFCQNTTRGFIKNGTLPAGDATAQIMDDVEYVTAGVTAISDLQEQGYRYVQP